jgi:hypothetical protein
MMSPTINEESDCLKLFLLFKTLLKLKLFKTSLKTIFLKNMTDFGGQDKIFKKVLLFAHAVVTGLLSPPPQEIRPTLKRGRYS